MKSTVAPARQKAASVPPFALRARLISPLADGSFLDLADGVIGCDAGGRIDWVGAAEDYAGAHPVVDLRPVAIIPGLVDTHAHLPQIPITGLANSRSLIGWLEEMMAPAERRFSGAACFDDAQTYFSAFAAVGTTTAVLYGSVDAAATDASFRAAADHGLRVILGQCLMDRMRYDDAPEAGITERRLAESESLCRRWHGYDAGRLGYAFTPPLRPQLFGRDVAGIRPDGGRPRGLLADPSRGRYRRAWPRARDA